MSAVDPAAVLAAFAEYARLLVIADRLTAEKQTIDEALESAGGEWRRLARLAMKESK